MRQASATALDGRMREGVERIGRAELLVGIPSYNNAATIGHVARTVAEGLRTHFGGERAVIVNADGGSRDGTSEVVRAATGESPTIAGAYVGPPGKGSAFRAIFEVADALGVRACAVVDSDLRSIVPEWVERLLGPVVRDDAAYVTPLYARHKYDGTITNTVAYPLTRALYGLRLRQPIGGEFGFSGDLARAFLQGDVWASDVARFGIDIYMTTTALVREEQIAQAFLGAKIHDPKDPGADLAPMFSQVVGTAFRLAIANAERWRAVRGSRPVEVEGPIEPAEPEPVNASVDTLERKFAAGRIEHEATWREVLGRSVGPRVDERDWAAIVYDFLVASRDRPSEIDRYVHALVPLYFARVADFIAQARDLSTERAEDLVERQAASFEDAKGALVARW